MTAGSASLASSARPGAALTRTSRSRSSGPLVRAHLDPFVCAAADHAADRALRWIGRAYRVRVRHLGGACQRDRDKGLSQLGGAGRPRPRPGTGRGGIGPLLDAAPRRGAGRSCLATGIYPAPVGEPACRLVPLLVAPASQRLQLLPRPNVAGPPEHSPA